MEAHDLLHALAALVAAQRLAELALAARNRRRALARGAVKHGAGHYPAMVALHVLWWAGWVLEARARGPVLDPLWPLWAVLLLLASALRYGAIASLGERWNTRILTQVGERPVRRGPYRWLDHPNYVAVALELAAFPMLFGAWATAGAAGAANLVLLLGFRLPTEERALRDTGGRGGREVEG